MLDKRTRVWLWSLDSNCLTQARDPRPWQRSWKDPHLWKSVGGGGGEDNLPFGKGFLKSSADKPIIFLHCIYMHTQRHAAQAKLGVEGQEA